MTTTVLLTGSNGFIGQKIAYDLQAHPEIKLICTSFSENLLPSNRLLFEKADLTNTFAVSKLFKNWKPDIVIHTAAQSQPELCETNQKMAYALNVTITHNLVNEIKKYGCHLVFFSTDFVFDGSKSPYTESDIPNPVSYYGRTKLEAEQLVAGLLDSWCIIRTIQVYGYLPTVKKVNLVLRVIHALMSGQQLQIVTDQWRTPTFVDDLSKATIELAIGMQKGIFHISGEQMMSVYEMAFKTATFFNLDSTLIKPVLITQLAEKAKRPITTGFDLCKLRSVIHYQPHDFLEGLKGIAKALPSNYIHR